MASDYQAFADRLGEFVRGPQMERSVALAKRYWSEPFTGQNFHLFADDDHPNEITERDIVAVSMLGVTIPAPVAIWLRSDDGRATVTELLTPVPTDIDIWDAGDLLAEDHELQTLWNILRTASWPTPDPANGMGTTKISKLLATKRPRLVPIFDRVVRKLLPPVSNYWAAFEYALSDQKLRVELGIASAGDAPEGTTLLRRIDAMLWMLGSNVP